MNCTHTHNTAHDTTLEHALNDRNKTDDDRRIYGLGTPLRRLCSVSPRPEFRHFKPVYDVSVWQISYWCDFRHLLLLLFGYTYIRKVHDHRHKMPLFDRLTNRISEANSNKTSTFSTFSIPTGSI